MRKLLLLTCFITTSLLAWSQDFSNKGKDFWIPYPEHANGTNSVMGIYITSDVNTTAEITVGSVVLSNIPVTANSVTRKFIGPNNAGDAPNSNVYLGNINDAVVAGKAIHITSLKPVAVFAHIIYGARSGATLVLPTAVWGREYIVPSFKNVGTGGPTNQGIGQVCVIASKPNTEIEVTTLVNSRNGLKTPGTYTITIPNPGDIYQLQFASNTEISGTIIRSKSNATTGCNPIAVFSATTWSAFPCTSPVASGGDNLFQQLFPSGTWGKKYLTAPLKKEVWNNADVNIDYLRVFVKDPATQVFKTENGVKTALTGLITPGNYYQYTTSRPTLIESDQPVQVVQYVTSQNCGNPATWSDPEMIVLSPVEQTVSNVSVFMAHKNFVPSGQSQVTRHYINVTMKTIHTAQFRINGNLPSTVFMSIPGTEYSYIKEELTAAASANPVFTLTADSGFNATAFGFGDVESYGYNAGTNVKDLYQTMTIQNEYGTVSFPAACKSSPFRFNITLPYTTNTLTWQFGGLFPDTTYTTSGPDSSWIVNGKPIYQYKLNRPYITASLGTFPITVFAYNPTPDGCAGLQEINWDLQIFENPVANFTFSHTGCVSDSVAFFDGSNPYGRPIIRNFWDYGDSKIDSVLNPKHKYLTAGSKTVRHSVITDVGCLSDTATKIIPITDPPVAGFSVNGPYCEKSTLTFSDNSSIAPGGTITKWIWNFGDGVIINATDANPVQHSFANTGTFTVSLQVGTASGCLSTLFTKTIIVNAKPVAAFSLPNVCLPAGSAQFNDLSTISDGTQSQFSHVWDFGDGSPAGTGPNPVHIYSGTGPYTVKLTVTSNNSCSDDSVRSLTTIYAQPQAVFTAPAAVCVSDSAAFSDQSTAPNSTVTQYYWDFGDATVSNLQNPKKKWANPGTYIVKHWVFSAIGCISDTGRNTVIVHALPTAAFSFPTVRCETKSFTFSDRSVPNSGNLNKWTWDFGDGSATDPGQNPVHTYATAGSYRVLLTVENDKGCQGKRDTQFVAVTAQPVAAFSMPGICLPDGNGQFFSQSTISDGTAGTFAYAWDFGDGGTATAKDPIHRYASVGPFPVTLRVTSAAGCVDDSVRSMTTIYPQPKALFNVSAEVCLNDSTRFTDISNGNGSTITEWHWNFADGNTSTDQNPAHRYLTAQTYLVKHFIVTDKGCHSDTLQLATVVNPLPTAAFVYSAPTCETKTVNFTDQSLPNAGNLVKWTWDFGDGSATDPGSNPVHTFSTAGTFNASLLVETNKGCKSTILQKPVKVNYQPQTSFGTPEVCLADPYAEFSDSTRIGDNTEAQFTYLWNFGDPRASGVNPNTSTAKNPRHTYTATGIYNVSLTVTSKDGCVTTFTKPFTVNGSVPQAAFTVNNANAICSNQEMSITDASTVNFGSVVKVEIYWDYANNPTIKTVDDLPNPGKLYQHQYPDFGIPATKTYTIRYVAYSGINCINEITKTVTVKASPKIQFDALANVCEEVPPFNITAARDIYNFAGTGTYSGPGILSGTGSFSAGTAKPGLHTLRYTFNAANGCSAFADQTITVDPTPVADAGPDRTVLEGGFIIINGKGTGNNVSYLWTPITAIADNKVATPKVAPVDDITYTLTVVSADGCKASDKVFVKVLKMPRVPNAFTPNGDGINDKWVIEFLDSYPGATIEVYNRYGQLLFQSVGYDKPWDGTLRGQPLPVATYYWIINPKNGRQQMNGSVTIIR